MFLANWTPFLLGGNFGATDYASFRPIAPTPVKPGHSHVPVLFIWPLWVPDILHEAPGGAETCDSGWDDLAGKGSGELDTVPGRKGERSGRRNVGRDPESG